MEELEHYIRQEIAASQRATDERLAAIERAIASLQASMQPPPAPVVSDERLVALELAVAALQNQPLPEPTATVTEERMAAVEQHVTQLTWQVQEWTGTDTTAIEERVAAMEQTVANLDKFARTLPPARWHHMHDTRSAELERRLAALEKTVQQAAWEQNGYYQGSSGAQTPWSAPAYAPSTPRRDYR
jgi:uncharacterized coiled-coil protein SlyX